MNIKRSLVLTVGLAIVVNAYGAAAAAAEHSAPGQETPANDSRRIVHVITSSGEPSSGEAEIERRFVIVDGDGTRESVVLPELSRKRGYLGVQLVELTPELRQHFGVPDDVGVMISKVVEDSPAAEAGLAAGDIVTAIDGRDMDSGVRIERTISATSDGTAVNVEVWRNGTALGLPVTIVERERPMVDLGRIPFPVLEDLESRVWVTPDRIQEHLIRIDPKGLEDALHELQLRVENPEFLEKFQALGQSRLELQQRITDLEERLKGLERELDRLPKD